MLSAAAKGHVLSGSRILASGRTGLVVSHLNHGVVILAVFLAMVVQMFVKTLDGRSRTHLVDAGCSGSCDVT